MDTFRSALQISFFLARGYASGRTYKLIIVRADNSCASLVFRLLISVRFCVSFSFIICVVLFYNKLNKIWSVLPFVRLRVNPVSRREGDVTIVLSFIVLCCIEMVTARNVSFPVVCCNCFVTDYVK